MEIQTITVTILIYKHITCTFHIRSKLNDYSSRITQLHNSLPENYSNNAANASNSLLARSQVVSQEETAAPIVAWREPKTNCAEKQTRI